MSDAHDEISHQAGKVMCMFYSSMKSYLGRILAFVGRNFQITQERIAPPGSSSYITASVVIYELKC